MDMWDTLPAKMKAYLLGEGLDPTMFDLLSNGFDDAEIEQIRDSIRFSFQEINGGGKAGAPDFDTLEKDLNEYRGLSTVISGSSLMFASKKIQDRFSYEMVPALSTLSNLGSSLSKKVGDAIKDAEEQKFHWGEVASNILFGAYGALRLIREIPKVIQTLRRLREVASLAKLVTRFNAATLAINIAIEVALYLGIRYGGQALGQFVADNYSYRMATQSFAANLFDKKRITGEAENFLGVLSGSRFAGDEGYGFLQGIARHHVMGVNTRMLGYEYQSLGALLKSVAPTTPMGTDQKFLAASVLYPTLAGNIEGQNAFQSLSLVPKQTVDDISEQFITFFGVLSGDGSLITSQTDMVNALADFANTYGFATKFNTGSPLELAKIAAFFSGTELVRLQTVAPVQALVQNLDSVLMAGAMLDNPRANELLALSGITPEEAIHGLTGDATLLPKMLTGISRKLGIGKQSFVNGHLSEEGYNMLVPYLMDLLHLEKSAIQPIVIALEAQVSGKSDLAIVNAYNEANKGFADRAATFRKARMPALVSLITEQEMVLSDMIRSNTNNLLDINDYMMSVVYKATRVSEIATDFVRKTADLLDIRYKTGKSYSGGRSTSESLPPPSYRGGGFAASVAGERNLEKLRGALDLGGWSRDMLRILAAPQYRGKMSDEFLDEAMAASKELGISPIDLLSIMFVETNTGGMLFSTKARNPDTKATGLIQFMPEVAEKDLGTSIEALYDMSYKEQFEYVVKYFKKKGIKPGMSLTDLYLTVLFPAAVGKPDNFVLMGEEGFVDANGIFFGPEALRANAWLNVDQSSEWEMKNLTRRDVELAIAGKTSYLFLDINFDYADKAAFARFIEEQIHNGAR